MLITEKKRFTTVQQKVQWNSSAKYTFLNRKIWKGFFYSDVYKEPFLEPKRKSINNILSNKRILLVIVNVNKKLIL